MIEVCVFFIKMLVFYFEKAKENAYISNKKVKPKT